MNSGSHDSSELRAAGPLDAEAETIRSRRPSALSAPSAVALLRRTARDSALLLAVVLAAVLAFEVLFVRGVTDLSGDILEFWRRIPFVRRILATVAGIDLSAEVSMSALVALGMVAPFYLLASWTFVIVTALRFTVSELDRGTADLLLTLPLPRCSVYVCVSLVWVGGALLISLTGWGGIALGAALAQPAEPLKLQRLGMVVANFTALLLAVGGLAMLAGSVASRLGPALAIVLVVLLASFLLNFLEAFLPWVKRVGVLGVLHYYRPVEAVASGRWPLRDILALAGAGFVFWLTGLWYFSRRDIPSA